MITDEMIRGFVGCQLSDQQFQACKAVATSKQNLLIEAVAGSGKTYTLLALIRLIKALESSSKILYLVFNKKNQLEAQEKIPESLATVKTFHAAGFGALRFALKGIKIDTDSNKNSEIMKRLDVPGYLFSVVKTLVSMGKSRAFDCENQPSSKSKDSWLDIIEHFGLEADLLEANTDLTLEELIDQAVLYAQLVFEESIKQAYQGYIDFDDQLYIPALDKAAFKSDLAKFDVVLIDEGQDTSTVRAILADKLCKSTGRVIVVGDRYQAIYGFAGADNDALDKLSSRFQCKSLPLSVTYRCCKAAVAYANQVLNIGEYIQAAENAIEGVLRQADIKQLITENQWKATDAIICRFKRPLIETAYKLLGKGTACQILGKDIAAGLLKLVKKWSRIKTLDGLRSKLESWKEEQFQKLTEKGKEAAAENLVDQVDCLLFLIDQMPANATLETLQQQISSMFTDENGLKQVTTLMTAHKSKGLEFNRVFWLDRSKCPSKMARKPWQMQQEINLMYVIATRAKEELIIC